MPTQGELSCRHWDTKSVAFSAHSFYWFTLLKALVGRWKAKGKKSRDGSLLLRKWNCKKWKHKTFLPPTAQTRLEQQRPPYSNIINKEMSWARLRCGFRHNTCYHVECVGSGYSQMHGNNTRKWNHINNLMIKPPQTLPSFSSVLRVEFGPQGYFPWKS